MTGRNLVSLKIESGSHELTTYLIAQWNSPETGQILSIMEECDAFIVTLDGKFLSDELVDEIAATIVKLPVDWVETFGPRCEYFHDRIDLASVSAGRQEKVGDGNPMTAWHNRFGNIDEIVSYIGAGGHGAAETKIVVLIGPEQSADLIARKIAQARG